MKKKQAGIQFKNVACYSLVSVSLSSYSFMQLFDDVVSFAIKAYSQMDLFLFSKVNFKNLQYQLLSTIFTLTLAQSNNVNFPTHADGLDPIVREKHFGTSLNTNTE